MIHAPANRAGASLLFLMPLAGCASCPAVHDVIRAKRLDLVNGSGAVVARLGVDEDGSTGLFLLDETGANRAALIHDDAQTALYLFDAAGTVRVGVAQYAHGGGGVALHGEASRGAAVLYMKDCRGTLTVYDEQGEHILRLPAAPADGQGELK